MSSPNDYRWLQIAGFVTLALAALVLVAAFNRHAADKRAREDVGQRMQQIMNQIEAEAQRMENAAAQP